MEHIWISGFADEIDADFDRQLEVLGQLGMRYLSLRAADGKNIAEYTVAEVREKLLPRLQKAGVGVSSLGSPIGKIGLNDEEGFRRQITQLDTLCRICAVLDCRYIRIFSFYLPEGVGSEALDAVAAKVGEFIKIAESHGVTLLLENEKGIFGDTGLRCRSLLDRVASPNCRAAFDYANFVQCGEDPVSCWALLKQDTAYIHVKDALYASGQNVPCGTGDGRIAELLEEAIRGGYRGFLTLEPHLASFEGLKDLEGDASLARSVIGDNGVRDGAEGFSLQYRLLQKILHKMDTEDSV